MFASSLCDARFVAVKFAALAALSVCAMATGARSAAARPFAHASAYSFDAPTDVSLSEDAGGCDNSARALRPSGVRVLRLSLYPDAYCSLMQAASCRYQYRADVDDRFLAGAQSMSRSNFTARWDNACVSTERTQANVAHGTLDVSEASDLGVFGTYDLLLTDGTSLHGVFDSVQCPSPSLAPLTCF